MFGGRSARYFSLAVGGEEGWRAKSQGRASESAKRCLVEMAEALLFPSLFREERGRRAGGSDSDSDDGQQRPTGRTSSWESNEGSSCQFAHIEMEGRVMRMARVENATAPLPYSAISGTGGSAGGGAHSCWRGSGSVECVRCPLPSAHGCGCGCSGRNPAAKQALALLKREVGSRRQGFGHTGRINCIRFFFAGRNSCPSDREQARNSELWAAMPLCACACACACPDLSEEMMMAVDHQHARPAIRLASFPACRLSNLNPQPSVLYHALSSGDAGQRGQRTRLGVAVLSRDGGNLVMATLLAVVGDSFGGPTQTPDIRHGHLEYELEGDNRPVFGLPESHFIFG